jgi:hypothetical protein
VVGVTLLASAAVSLLAAAISAAVPWPGAGPAAQAVHSAAVGAALVAAGASALRLLAASQYCALSVGASAGTSEAFHEIACSLQWTSGWTAQGQGGGVAGWVVWEGEMGRGGMQDARGH